MRDEQGAVINKIKHLLRRHNLQWNLPTKRFPTQRAVAWLKVLVLPGIDRMEMAFLVDDLERAQQRIDELERIIIERSQHPLGGATDILIDVRGDPSESCDNLLLWQES